MNNELERLWEKGGHDYYSGIYVEDLRKAKETPSQDNEIQTGHIPNTNQKLTT
jgi:hypothetical protein